MATGRIRFELFVNGQRQAIAGIRSHGVLTANIVWGGNAEVEITPQIRADPDFNEREWVTDDIHVRLGGLDSETEEHLKWFQQDLRPGDEVTLRVLPAGECDAPLERHVRAQPGQEAAGAEPPAA